MATSFAKNPNTIVNPKLKDIKVKEEVMPCVYNIVIKNTRGEVVKTIPYNGTTYDWRDCFNWATNNVKIWTAQLSNSPGYTAEHDLY